ncbi:MAG: hypothetical protein KBD50_00510 [Candidatus Pacebacteria bacterium]|nr:hypothetical protein [Candidatus Paceibacterota bacterium]
MQVLITCSECGHKEWGYSERDLMNKIKLVNHASKAHPTQLERIMRLSLPKVEPVQPLAYA